MKKRIMLLILLLTIGFASVSATLILNGIVGVGVKNDDFEVIFVEALLDGEETNKATIESNKKSITLNTDKLTNVGDKTELVYKVKNNSTQYGANVTVSCTNDASEYISITSIFDDKTIPLTTPIEIEAQEIKRGKITDELTKSYTGSDTSIDVTCTIVTSAIEKENVVEYVPIEEYKEEILNGTDPVVKEGLIPVVIENDGTVKKADIETEWYNYENKEWANAVILSDETITYNKNEVIPEENIESYFVWIPKYKYKLWNVASTTTATNKGKHSIEIEFGTDDTENVEGVSCIAPMNAEKTQAISGASSSCNNGEWMTHPAFISMGTNGIWVGKFETTGTTSSLNIKPNVTSLRNLNVKTMFDTAYNYQRKLDSHMMKNTEWGAVAYLSHSIFGINREVSVNNNSSYQTGYSSAPGVNQNKFPGTTGTDASKTLPYNTETGFLSSTTGNITGIYDMSGGSDEYMASYINGRIGSSEFTDITNSAYAKYLDIYSASSSVQSYQYRILGDATGEMGPFSTYADGDGHARHHNTWYADNSYFPDTTYPWFLRGGYYYEGVIIGQFAFSRSNGVNSSSYGFRLVLV